MSSQVYLEKSHNMAYSIPWSVNKRSHIYWIRHQESSTGMTILYRSSLIESEFLHKSLRRRRRKWRIRLNFMLLLLHNFWYIFHCFSNILRDPRASARESITLAFNFNPQFYLYFRSQLLNPITTTVGCFK